MLGSLLFVVNRLGWMDFSARIAPNQGRCGAFTRAPLCRTQALARAQTSVSGPLADGGGLPTRPLPLRRRRQLVIRNQRGVLSLSRPWSRDRSVLADPSSVVSLPALPATATSPSATTAPRASSIRSPSPTRTGFAPAYPTASLVPSSWCSMSGSAIPSDAPRLRIRSRSSMIDTAPLRTRRLERPSQIVWLTMSISSSCKKNQGASPTQLYLCRPPEGRILILASLRSNRWTTCSDYASEDGSSSTERL